MAKEEKFIHFVGNCAAKQQQQQQKNLHQQLLLVCHSIFFWKVDHADCTIVNTNTKSITAPPEFN